jgi:hypothetical protein
VANFSQYSAVTVPLVAAFIEGGRQPTDEMLLEAFERLDPPLLAEEPAAVVHAILTRKRGRRSKRFPPASEVAAMIAASERADVPRSFLDGLAARLKRGRGITNFERQLQAHIKAEKRTREMLIHGLFRDFENVESDGPSVDHPVLGRIEIPPHDGTPRGRNAALVQHVLQNKLARMDGSNFDPPSVGTILNTVSRFKKYERIS